LLCSKYFIHFPKFYSMSKKKKVSTGKAVKKTAAKKPVKKATKPAVKKKAASGSKKPAVKTVKSKKPVKSSPKKSATPKKTIKKVVAKIAVKKAPKASKVAAKSTLKAVKITKKATVPSPKTKNSAAKTNKKSLHVAPLVAKKPSKPEPKKPLPMLPKKESAAASEKAKKAEETATKKQNAERKSQEVLAINNTIPVKEKNEISLSKIASISHSITNPIKKTDSYAIKPEKEPSGKFEMEFVVHSSAEMLYEFLSTPSGLSEWFCDDLNIRNGIYTFIWDDQLQQARLLKTVDLQLVRFQWVDKTDGSYFEFRIQRDDLTNDIALIITDFAETVSERESSKLLWHSQIEKLMHVIGSIF